MPDLIPSDASPRPDQSPFDRFRHRRPDGTEFWSARDLQIPFGYGAWREFEKAILAAADDFLNLGGNADDHFVRAHKMAPIGSGAYREIIDYELTRAACYVTAMRCNTEEGSFARAYFAAQTRRAELHTPPVGTPALRRPWSERLDQSIMDHRQFIKRHLPAGAFSIYTGTIPEILTLEDVLIHHLLPLLQSDGPDNSMGQRWPRYRKGKSWARDVFEAPLYMPAHRLQVSVMVYQVEEWGPFCGWLQSIYLPQNLPTYLCKKYKEDEYGLAPPSAAEHTCLQLTGAPAILKPRHRRLLVAVGGFAPVGAQLPLLPQQRDLFDQSTDS